MATERNVVDFKIHNLTEEQFQELKAQGQIDPNAVYCTPDDTKIKIAELEAALVTTNETVATNDSNAVHKTGNETIDGKKTFKQNLALSYDSLDLSTVQESGSWHTWCQVFDKNGVRASYIETAHKADGTVQQQMGVQKPIDGTKYGAFFRMYIDANKKQHYELAASPESGSNGTDVATTKWVNDAAVHKTGDETIGGTKTFAAVRIRLQNTNLGSFKEIEAWGENGTARLGVLRFTNGNNGVSRTVALNVVDNTNTNKGGLAVGIDGEGYLFATAPTPAASSNDTHIATTAWVKNYGMGAPDYANKTQITSGATMSAHGWVFGGRYASELSAQIKVNDNVVYYSSTSHAGNAYGIVPVAKGDVVTLGSGTYYFVPCKNS